ncbi:hypothetical protein CoNPh4_CDS0107 [Staphylococcus phage S-CoN_Ph4]|nr:hypothetical protein CoNPh4_CDS0107 [Staphylococcus phage S-CoN_Ph4]WNM52666.1 hypothetical protein CoNPh8_CDS0112 [Staphylococcus phage S-CoN_Ph8]WNM55921.1 hypothetical protein CoNPh38_CDS0045 [Staphylococcus phage S-CoN_Ph38]
MAPMGNMIILMTSGQKLHHQKDYMSLYILMGMSGKVQVKKNGKSLYKRRRKKSYLNFHRMNQHL